MFVTKRAVVQRVSECSILINDQEKKSMGWGFLVLLGVEALDQEDDVLYLANKIVNMRIFSDQEGKMNLALSDIGGSIMVVSQFTLFASTKKGNRPSFLQSAKPDIAIPLYESFISNCKKLCTPETNILTGEFGADMKITFTNDGPVTILLDSKNRE